MITNYVIFNDFLESERGIANKNNVNSDILREYSENFEAQIESDLNFPKNGYLESSDISIECMATPNPNTKWGKYIAYLFEWAIGHSDEEFENMSPACYDEWLDNEYVE